MKILFVAMPDSIHTARWINTISDQGWEIFLFPSYHAIPNPEFHHIKIHDRIIGRRPEHMSETVTLIGYWPFRRYSRELCMVGNKIHEKYPDFRQKYLNNVIKKVKPDIIHSLEFQQAGYLALNSKLMMGPQFPKWIATNWGSDIYLFGRLKEHQSRIKAILQLCDYYSCECRRDLLIAREFGLKGKELPVVPNTGGFDLSRIQEFRQPGPVSQRKTIIMKGYQNWAGRALFGLQALKLSRDVLDGYKICIFSANNDVALASELLSSELDLKIEIIPQCEHDQLLKIFGKSRIYIGLSISDAISTSLLEAITMGAFPIQSNTSCADEWIQHGKTGFIVPPEDPRDISSAIKTALQDDRLVDYAAEANQITVKDRLDREILKPRIIDVYEKIMSGEQ